MHSLKSRTEVLTKCSNCGLWFRGRLVLSIDSSASDIALRPAVLLALEDPEGTLHHIDLGDINSGDIPSSVEQNYRYCRSDGKR